MLTRNYKAQFGLSIKIFSVYILILKNSSIWLVNTKPQNKQMPWKNLTQKNVKHMWLYNENEF